MDLQSVYEYTLRREYDVYEFYLQNAARVRHPSAADIFRRFAEEEEAHILHIKGLMAALEEDEEIPALDLEEEGAFAQRAGAELLDEGVIESMMPDVAVLRTAYLIERDLAEYYEMLEGSMEGPVRETFAALAEWERQHERLLQRLHDRVFEQYTGTCWETLKET